MPLFIYIRECSQYRGRSITSPLGRQGGGGGPVVSQTPAPYTYVLDGRFESPSYHFKDTILFVNGEEASNTLFKLEVLSLALLSCPHLRYSSKKLVTYQTHNSWSFRFSGGEAVWHQFGWEWMTFCSLQSTIA